MAKKKSATIKLISHTEKIKGNDTIITAKIKAINSDTAKSYFKGRFGVMGEVETYHKLNTFTIVSLY